MAAFSPSGLSLDAPAHILHKALLTELLTIYNLFGDPAMKVR